METHREKSKPSLDNHIVARSLGFVAAIIAVPAFIISIPPVQSALFNSSPEIQISLVNEIPVFDVLRPIPGLKVLYEGELLTPTRRSIVASRIRIENIGGKSLTPADISPKDPLGFSVENGKIIRLNKVRSNSAHLRRLINAYTNNKNVTLNYGLIFDPKDYVEFDILILKSSHQPLTYDPLGKVSEQESIDFINETSSLKEKSFTERIFSGKISDQIIKIFVYSFIGFGFITILEGLFNFAEYSLKKVRNRKLERIAISSLEHMPKIDPKIVGIALSIFSFAGLKMTKNLIIKLDSEFKREEFSLEIPDEVEIMGKTIKSDRLSITKYLLNDGFISMYAIITMIRHFKLTKLKAISADFMTALESIVTYAEKARADRWGTNFSDFVVRNPDV